MIKFNSEVILRGFVDFTRSIITKSDAGLVSFSFEIEYADFISLVEGINKVWSDVFFFQSPNSALTLLGINSALDLTNDSSFNFNSVSSNFNLIRNNLTTNSGSTNAIPLVCCSAKFDSERTSALWNSFEQLRIYIPQFLLVRHNGRVRVYYNFLFQSNDDIDSYSSAFRSYLEKISALSKLNPDVSAFRSLTYVKPNNEEKIEWNDKATKALEELELENIRKLVLSRSYSFNLNSEINWNYILNELNNRFPDCYLFSVKSNDSVFFGSSPELFLKVSDSVAEVESVAGSAPRGKRSDSDFEFESSLRSSEKNHQEHLFVSNFITDILFQYSNNIRVIEEKQIRKLDNIQHLITKISADLSFKEQTLELIDELFPTPAVAGVPKEKARNFIRKLETHDRGLYSGLVGVMDLQNNCELAVAIRSAIVKENQVTAFAGAGIVKNSNVDEEFLETKLKLDTILSLFIDEN